MNADDGEARTSGGEVTLHISDGVATVVFGHPKGNALPGELLHLLEARITDAGRDPTARVIVLRSTGTGPFCAGASFSELAAIQDVGHGASFFNGFARVILAMIRAPKFVVCRVQGKVVGGGVGLVAASDFSFAVPGASVRLSELSVGIGAFVVGPCIERRIGPAAFAAMSVDTRWRDAGWCEQRGLYSTVCPDSSALDPAVGGLVDALAGYSPEAMRELKRVFWSGTEDWEDLMARRAEVSGRLVMSEFTRAAIRRFNEA